MASFTKIAGAADGLPSAINSGAPGLIGGSALSLMIASGATRATLAIYNYVASVDVVDPAAFAQLPNGSFGVGWSSPRTVKVDAVTPVPIGGSGGASSIYAVGASFAARIPRMVDGGPVSPGSSTRSAVPYIYPPDPAPIAVISGGPVFVALVDTDAAPGTSIVFSVGGS